MEIIIRNSSAQPLYAQIVTQIRAQILTGKLHSGDPLPSIRALAKDLKISVITTKRAYDELENAGLIDTVAGKGCFVTDKRPDALRESQMRELEQHLTAAIQLAKDNAVSLEQLMETLRLLWEEPL